MSEELTKLDSIPVRIKVKEILSSRYNNNKRPLSWDERKDGNDIVRSEDGRILNLFSNGQQSPPQPGWVILIKGGDADKGYNWTLYGMTPGS
ncbi:MAG: hypothetical protein D6719_05360 [Candidatus Dadabacteria bacterium]|nr:MAG: hypothetical protein D6719_05360 [Candidatus Dadabacteria bacterium]